MDWHNDRKCVRKKAPFNPSESVNMKFRLGCKVAHEDLEPGFAQISRWRETYLMFQLESSRLKWGLRLFWVHCPLCGRRLLLSLVSWPIKTGLAALCTGIYAYFALKALHLHRQGNNIPDNLSYILIFGACGLWLCLCLLLTRGPGIIHPLGGRLTEPMHSIDHKCT